MGEVMDRGSAALKSTLENCATLEVRHARRGVLQEWLCCITKSSFKYYEGEKKIAQSKEKFNFFHRCLLAPIHPFGMTIKEAGTGEELIDVDRSGRCCLACGKCCCFQDAVIYSGGKDLGEISETCWCFVPKFKVYNDKDETVYIIHPPTCCGGTCIDFYAEGHPCPHGCCLIPFRIYPGDAKNTDGDAPYIGKMAKIPKETCWDTFNEKSFVKIDFPKGATADEKGLVLGSFVLINALFFEGSE